MVSLFYSVFPQYSTQLCHTGKEASWQRTNQFYWELSSVTNVSTQYRTSCSEMAENLLKTINCSPRTVSYSNYFDWRWERPGLYVDKQVTCVKDTRHAGSLPVFPRPAGLFADSITLRDIIWRLALFLFYGLTGFLTSGVNAIANGTTCNHPGCNVETADFKYEISQNSPNWL